MDIKKSTMRKIRVIWFFRRVFNVTTAKAAALIAMSWQMTSYVSIKNVIGNLPASTDFSASYAFFEAAVLNTEIMTQILLLGIVVLGVWLFRDIEASQRGFNL